MHVIGQCHNLLHASGVTRIQTDIRVGTRTDKKQSAQDKLSAVQNLLARDNRTDDVEPKSTCIP